MADELNLDEEPKRPKWVKPEQQGKPQPRPQRQEWVNPKRVSYREKMDRRLERAGLLNYQTEGLSAEEIARRYAVYNIKVADNSTWFKDNYGYDAPSTITNRQEMDAWRKQAFSGNGAPNIMPSVNIDLTPTPSGGTADRPVNFVTGANGLLVRAPQTQPQAVTDSPYAASVFATMEQARAGAANWTDVASTERAALLKDPTFYKSGQITQYPTWMQQQILADPAFDWDQLPAWQRAYYELSSSPAGMGAVQGGLMGSFGGPVGAGTGLVVGSVLGWGAGKSGYDATKEFWQQDTKTAGAFGLMNWLAEQMEKGLGVIAQGTAILTGNDPNFDPTKRNLDIEFNKDFSLKPGENFNPELLSGSTWDAGANFFEVMGPAYRSALPADDGKFTGADVVNRIPLVSLYKLYDVMANPEKYKGEEIFLGAADPIQLDKTWVERLQGAEDEIAAGRPYREVMMDLQAGVVAQISDMVGQAVVDPLNFLPDVQTKVAGAIAEAGGNKVAATAFKQSDSLVEAGRKYRTLIQSNMATTIDPNFKVDQMGRFSRFVAGINEQGQVKAGSVFGTSRGLLDPIKNKTGWLEDMTTQTPHSRAQTGAGMFYENVSAMLGMFNTPEEAAKYLRALANNDMNTWAELGTRFAESPEFYTVLPALKEFAADGLDGITKTWEMTAPNRDLLTRIADVMGDQPGKFLDDLVKRGTAEQDFARLVKKLGESTSEGAKALLADVEAGRLNAETLKQMVDVFTGEGALPWHPGQWKALMLNQLGDHFDSWVTQRLMLNETPEAKSAFFRTSALMKQAQSILLLGGSPGYAITNGLSNMVHRSVSGLYGYMTPGQINSFVSRFEVTPARFDEGVGIGGMVEQAAGSSAVKTSAMDKAVKGKGPLTVAKDALGKISKGMPFSKLSSWFEKIEGRQAFTIGMKDMWSQSWRRGVGFREMSPQLAQVMTEMGIDPQRMYAAIEAGMNQTEIEKALTGRQAEVQARSLIHDAAQKTGMGVSETAQMLERVGVLDTLDQFLKGQITRDGVAGAFRRAESVAQDWMDMRAGEDLKARAENVKQKVGLEGAVSALDVVQKAHGEYTDAWMDHYYRFGEVMNDLLVLGDDAQKSKAIDYAYAVSDKEFRRVHAANAANYKGIFEAWGMSGDVNALRVLESVGESDAAMGGAYRQMRENWREWREKWAGDPTNPARWDEMTALRGKNDTLFKQAFRLKHDAEVKMGAALGDIYEGLHGAAAGEAARQWWESVVEFNDEIVKRERDFRGEMAQAARSGVPKELIDVQKQKYYSETKILLIAELEQINAEGIARLERVIKKGGTSGEPSPSPTRPPTPTQPEVTLGEAEAGPAQSSVAADLTVDEVNGLLSASDQRKGAEATAKAARVDAVWEVAGDYWGKGGQYNKGILQDRFALLAALQKPEYGGIADLKWLDDPRLTPEKVREVLEARKAAKEGHAAAAAEATFEVTAKEKKRAFDVTQINENILRAIALHGGIDLSLAKDLTGESKPKSAPGVFTRKGHSKGYGIDEMARLLADDGYAIDLNRVDDVGGIQQATDLINRARAGDKVYPMGHDYSADLSAAEAAWAENFNFDEVPEVPFDSRLWQQEFENAVQFADLGRVYEMIGGLPDAMLDQPLGAETWREYVSRAADDVAARVEDDARRESVAGRAAEAEVTIREAETHAEAVTQRALLMESLAESFGLNEAETRAYGEMSDAVADWYARMTGESVDEFYTRYFDEARKGSAADVEGLLQQAFHGSPYKFDKFTLEKIGAGEGAQAYGWGLYFAGDKSVAEYYRQKLAGDADQPPRRFFKGQELVPGTPEYHAATLMSRSDFGGSLKKARQSMTEWIKQGEIDLQNGRLDNKTLEGWKQTLDILNQATNKKDFTEKPNAGQLYEVDIPDEGYLLWDKPLSEEQAVKIGTDIATKYGLDLDYTIQEYKDYKSGSVIYKMLSDDLGGDKAASMYLKDMGFNGIQYLDGSSRGKGEGNYNYVIFDDAAVQIKETYYQANLTPNPSPKGEGSLAVNKGMVTFEGLKGTITAFEAADFSTVIHESGHIYRKMLADVAERTKNPYILKDLQTIEEWAGVKDGKWERVHEEKFARGFERYITEGNAPTPKLRAAFESFRGWMLGIYKQITGSQIDVKMTDEVRRVFDRMLGADEQVAVGFDPESQWVDTKGRIHMKVRAELEIDPNTAKADARALLESEMGARLKAAAEARKARQDGQPLFQSDIPFGMYDEQSGFRPSGEGMDAMWREKVRPVLQHMEQGAYEQLQGMGEGAFRDMSPEGQAMLRKYTQQVKNEMATAKLATVRYAEKQRDFALLNYSKRYGFDRYADFILPYQFYTSRSMVNWAARALDKPALYSNYARLRMQQERYERDIPERLRGKIRIPAPWLPEWAGDGLYIDPFRNLFFPETIMRSLERQQQDKNYQVIEAERVLQEWQADGQYNDAQIIEAAKTQQGKVWERAWEEAQIRRENESANPVDFFTSFFGPAWYLSTPLNLAGIKVPGISKGDPNKVNTVPLGNTARALDTVTQDTWAEPFGDLIGLIGKGEDKLRESFDLPTRGEYAEYYTKRQVANMVAEGKISPEDAQVAMIEKSGDIWTQAQQRVDMELALRVPLAGTTYAALHEGPGAAAQAALPSLFGASLLPAGELEYRGLKQEWNEAWKLADAGDKTAVQRFFDNHPEYEAYLAKNKDDGELLKSFLIGEIWDSYMALGDTNKKQARAEMGETFAESFLNKETRSYETLDVNQLAAWARMLGAQVPTPPTSTPTLPLQSEGDAAMKLYPEQVTGITDQYFEQRREKFPNYYEEQSAYYNLPKSERKKYLLDHPQLKEYWQWKDNWYDAYPEFVPIFKGDAFDRVDTSGWMPGLEDAVRAAAFSGRQLPSGARAALMNIWLLEGQPMDDYDTWVTSVVMPGMMYGD